MDFYATLDEVVELLRSRGRVSYRAIKEQFGVDAERLEALRVELLYAHADNVRADKQGLTWTSRGPDPADAERRQLTVLFCDLVDSTPLSGQLDPEDLREVMRAYYETCGKVIARFDGYIAQYLGDGLLVFFGYPLAHEDDAQRAARTGLGIIEAVGQLNGSLVEHHGVSLGVRLGCHTGLVVAGEVVGESRHELMAMGDTPNIAARLQGVAAVNTLVVGALTHHLLAGQFNCQSLGTPPLKGVAAPLEVFEVLNENAARTRLEVIGIAGLTRLVGRSGELRILEEHWASVVGGRGQTVVVTGEAGIGKSRLVHALTESVADQQGSLMACQGSPYHRDTAFHPLIDLLERAVLGFARTDSPSDKVRKLEGFLVQSGLPLPEAMPALCSLLSIPPGAEYEFAPSSPEQRKQQTMQVLLSVLLRRSGMQPLLFVVEDLHWIDPSTIEFLGRPIEEIDNARILALFTCRPDFASPWTDRADVTDVSLTRLAPDEAAELTGGVAQGKSLPDEIVEQIVSRTDGVPLFIEELTKMLLESGLLEEGDGRYHVSGPIPHTAIPNTLHDSLMARLDRLSTVKGLAQLGAAIGREFSYALLRAVSPWDDELLHEALAQLVAAEFLHQQGSPPDATYRFKHALIQDAAYQSLLKAARRQHHQRIAAALESDFTEIKETQPELLAHHYTEAEAVASAVPLWAAAGRRALQRYANQEATNHAARGLELLATLPETPDRLEQELSLQLLLGASLGFVNGPHAGEPNYTRARELARQIGATPELFPALAGLAYAHIVQGQMRSARALSQEFLELAQPQHDPQLQAVGHWLMAYTAWWQGDFADVRTHSRRGLASYDPDQHRAFIATYGQDPGVVCGYLKALSDWALGYPAQATIAMDQLLTYARGLEHPGLLGMALLMSAQLCQLRREPELALVQADEGRAIGVQHGLHAVTLWCQLPRGWAMAQLGDAEQGLADITAAMDIRRQLGIGAVWPWFLALAAEVHGALGQFDAAFDALDEARERATRNDERLYAAEVYRINGELLLRKNVADPVRAERCFEQALAVARQHDAKSWELRAATSMARMWLTGGRPDEARALLSPVYEWFTEGFETADLNDARTLLAQPPGSTP